MFLCLCFVSVFYVSANSKFRRISTLEGLSQNDVNCIFQDSRGFIWIGTNDGLNRYDGYDFKIFQVNPNKEGGIPSNLIFKIQEDREGNLWLGTSDKGLIKFDVTKNEFLSLSEVCGKEVEFDGNRIGALYIDSNENIWIGTNRETGILIPKDNGLYDLKVFDDPQIRENYIPDQSVYSFFETRNGDILICGTNSMFMCLNKSIEAQTFMLSFLTLDMGQFIR